MLTKREVEFRFSIVRPGVVASATPRAIHNGIGLDRHGHRKAASRVTWVVRLADGRTFRPASNREAFRLGGDLLATFGSRRDPILTLNPWEDLP